MSRSELFRRVGFYGNQIEDQRDEDRREERRERLAASDEGEVPFREATGEDMLNDAPSEEPAEQFIDQVIEVRRQQAQAAVELSKLTREQRLGREVALAIEQRVSELEDEKADDPLEHVYGASPRERAEVEAWLEEPGDDEVFDESDYDWDDGEAA